MTSIRDDFTRANTSGNGTAIGASPTGGVTPTTTSSQWKIDTNRLGYGNSTIDTILWDAGITDAVVEAQIVGTAANMLGPVLRAVDANNYWIFWGNAGASGIWKVVGGVLNRMAVWSGSFSLNDVAKFTVVGNVFTGYVNGTSVVTYTDSTYNTATKHGIFSNSNNGGCYIDYIDIAPSGTNTANGAVAMTAATTTLTATAAGPGTVSGAVAMANATATLTAAGTRVGNVYDDFNRADSTTIGPSSTGNVTPDTGSYTWQISTNRLGTTTGYTAEIQWDSGIVDASCEIKIVGVSAIHMGPMVRCSGEGNGWIFWGNGSAGGIYKEVSGSLTQVAFYSSGFAVNDVVKFTAVGNTYTGYINGTQVVQYVDASNQWATATKQGIFSNGNGGDSLADYVDIQSASAAPTLQNGAVSMTRATASLSATATKAATAAVTMSAGAATLTAAAGIVGAESLMASATTSLVVGGTLDQAAAVAMFATGDLSFPFEKTGQVVMAAASTLLVANASNINLFLMTGSMVIDMGLSLEGSGIEFGGDRHLEGSVDLDVSLGRGSGDTPLDNARLTLTPVLGPPTPTDTSVTTGGTVTGGTTTGGVLAGGTLQADGTITGGIYTGGTTTDGTASGSITTVLTDGTTVSGGEVTGGTTQGGTIIGGVYTPGTQRDDGTWIGGTLVGGVGTGGTTYGGTLTGGTVVDPYGSGGGGTPYRAPTIKWSVWDGANTFGFAINPSSMSSVYADATVEAQGTTGGGVVVMEGNPKSATLTFSGALLDQSQYETLVVLLRKRRRVMLFDHLTRSYEVIFTSFKPVPRRGVDPYPWHHDYSATCLILRSFPPTDPPTSTT